MYDINFIDLLAQSNLLRTKHLSNEDKLGVAKLSAV